MDDRKAGETHYPLWIVQNYQRCAQSGKLFGGAMKRTHLSAIFLCFWVQHTPATAISCPPYAPQEWSERKLRLESVRVMVYLTGDVLDEEALPSGPPDREARVGQQLYQTWITASDSPEVMYAADCLYERTGRYLRFDLKGTSQCTARWRMSHAKPVAKSLSFRCN